ncbi:hypothetical protein FOCC_FOCC015226, partial [Frankliniella occidentalis]
MVPSTYRRNEQWLGTEFEKMTLESMLEAGMKEVLLAIEAGDVSPDGVPWIRVIADGMWGKRSYGTTYNAKSGVAFIIGARTRKVLFYAVKNKHCFLCVLYLNSNRKIKTHTCAKNFSGASGQMESAILLSGFQASMDMHGVRYLQLVADRDSTVHTTLLDSAPYGVLHTVQKIDCKNHLLRNYRTWCMQLSTNTNFPLPDGAKDQGQEQFWRKEIRALRSEIKKNITRLATGICQATTYRSGQMGTLHERTQNLRKDILNVASHVFGDHKACADYFCPAAQQRRAAAAAAAATSAPGPSQCTGGAGVAAPEQNLVPRLEKSGLWRKLMENLDSVANHAHSLIHNANNNLCEVANSVVAKFIAGKRVFYSGRESFNTRCAAAALAMNTSGGFREVMHRELQDGASPGQYTAKHSETKVRRLKQQRTRRAIAREQPGPRPRRVCDAPGGPQGYGLEARAPGDRDESVDDPDPAAHELPLEEDPQLERRMQEVTDRLQADLTRLQEVASYPQGGHQWMEARKIRLTASTFGPIVRRERGKSCKILLRTMVHTPKNRTAAMQHGTDMEETARRHYEEKHGLTVERVGLVVDKQLPFLAASPDGLIGDEELLEIKCPTSGVDFESAEVAVREQK